ncbi:MAG: PGPGW domain-containing protein [Betaproteobacteria bacterium]|nr:PGPGW domain-containing protein [Betaproteobacteria bacterium]
MQRRWTLKKPEFSLRGVRRLVVAVIGTTVLAFGLALTVLPGPAIVVIPIGLGILATEFLWARRLLDRFRQGASRIFRRNDSGGRQGRQ